jgi:hypothetical protein
VSHELFMMTEEGGMHVPLGTARRRRLTRQQRKQRAHRWARWRAGLRGEP